MPATQPSTSPTIDAADRSADVETFVVEVDEVDDGLVDVDAAPVGSFEIVLVMTSVVEVPVDIAETTTCN